MKGLIYNTAAIVAEDFGFVVEPESTVEETVENSS